VNDSLFYVVIVINIYKNDIVLVVPILLYRTVVISFVAYNQVRLIGGTPGKRDFLAKFEMWLWI
jgi:hypothetical protein